MPTFQVREENHVYLFLPFLSSRCKNNVARFKTKFWVRFWCIWTRGLEFCGTWIRIV
jgi:hypothetical protein